MKSQEKKDKSKEMTREELGKDKGIEQKSSRKKHPGKSYEKTQVSRKRRSWTIILLKTPPILAQKYPKEDGNLMEQKVKINLPQDEALL